MIDAETAAEWAQKEPQRSFIATAERLEEQGFTATEQAESLLALTLTMLSQIHGPQWVAARLVLLADKYQDEAATLRRASGEAQDGPPN